MIAEDLQFGNQHLPGDSHVVDGPGARSKGAVPDGKRAVEEHRSRLPIVGCARHRANRVHVEMRL
jgi:hypothetical protein